MDSGVIKSTGNVFADLGLPHSDEDMLRVEIAVAITGTVSKLGLTQIDAAERMRVDQATVSRLTRGRLDGISVERLLNFLTLLGRDVDISISKAPSQSTRSRSSG
jgi:predicted XRE-type DNA-binding protein